MGSNFKDGLPMVFKNGQALVLSLLLRLIRRLIVIDDILTVKLFTMGLSCDSLKRERNVILVGVLSRAAHSCC